MSRIGFVGVGVMGMPMALNLIGRGHRVRAFDIDPAALAAIGRKGAGVATSPGDAAEGADFVITMLPTGEHVADAVFGAYGVAEALAGDSLLIEMSTGLPSDFDALAAQLGDRGGKAIDAPVGRTSREAETGTLLIMVGGEAGDVELARPVLECLGDTIVHCGPAGAGIRTKLVNNYLSIVSNVVVAEALAIAEGAGLDRDTVIEVLMGTTAGRGHLGTTYPAKVLAGDLEPGFHGRPGPKRPGTGPDNERRSRLPHRDGRSRPPRLRRRAPPGAGAQGLDGHLPDGERRSRFLKGADRHPGGGAQRGSPGLVEGNVDRSGIERSVDVRAEFQRALVRSDPHPVPGRHSQTFSVGRMQVSRRARRQGAQRRALSHHHPVVIHGARVVERHLTGSGRRRRTLGVDRDVTEFPTHHYAVAVLPVEPLPVHAPVDVGELLYLPADLLGRDHSQVHPQPGRPDRKVSPSRPGSGPARASPGSP